jgi:hypothetical protein
MCLRRPCGIPSFDIPYSLTMMGREQDFCISTCLPEAAQDRLLALAWVRCQAREILLDS